MSLEPNDPRPSTRTRDPEVESAPIPPAVVGVLLLLVVALAVAFVIAAQTVQTP